MRIKRYTIAIVGSVLLISATIVTNDRLFEISKNLELFAQVFKDLNTNYVDEVDPSSLMKIGIDAMVASLDPYTNYISESQVESYRISDDEKYQGIGASLIVIEDRIYLDAPQSGGPSQIVGMTAGDEILSVNNVPVKGKTAAEVNSVLRGAAGTTVIVTVKKLLSAENKTYTVKRDEVNISNVPYSGFVSDGVGYINLTTFTANSTANISKALKKLKADNPDMKGVVIDLRFNGGGLLREAIGIVNLFLPKGEEVVFTKGKMKDKDQSYKTFAVPEDLDLPIVVMVNGKSASASEIVAGVLQDMDRAVIIGQRSYGKGLVQNIFDLSYNSRLKVTISKYYIPSGRCIQGVEYKNGEPMDISDSKRSKFKTKNGRDVLDGGGITPDVRLTKVTHPEILDALLDQKMIFEYANKFVLKQDSIKNMDEFTFSTAQYEDFLGFLKSKKFDFKISGEQYIDSLTSKNIASTNLNQSVKDELNSMKKKVQDIKSKELTIQKESIIHELEKEIVSRYFYQEGRTKIGLKRDSEIQEAIKLLNNRGDYNKLLKIKS